MKLSIEELFIIKWALEEREVELYFSQRNTKEVNIRDIYSDKSKANATLLGRVEAEIRKEKGI